MYRPPAWMRATLHVAFEGGTGCHGRSGGEGDMVVGGLGVEQGL